MRPAYEDSSTARSIDRHSNKRSRASSVPQWASISCRSRIATSTAVCRSIARSESASARRSHSQMISALTAAPSETAVGCKMPLNQQLAATSINPFHSPRSATGHGSSCCRASSGAHVAKNPRRSGPPREGQTLGLVARGVSKYRFKLSAPGTRGW